MESLKSFCKIFMFKNRIKYVFGVYLGHIHKQFMVGGQ